LLFASHEVSVNAVIERQEFDSTGCYAGAIGFAGSNPNTDTSSFTRVNHTIRARSNCFDQLVNRRVNRST
jgi:hypothetical protein